MTTNLIPTAQSTFVPAVAKLVTSCCQSSNVVHRQVTSRVGVFALIVLALNETAFQSTLVLAKIPFAMLKVVYDALAPNPLPEALGFKAVGEHVERVKQFAEILFIDTAPMLASPTDIGAICIERGLVKGPSHFETLKQHVWTHRHTILKAGIVLAGAYISYRYLTAPTVVLPPSPANPPAPSPSSAPAVQPTPPTTSAVLAPTPAPTLASIAPTPVNAKQRPSPWTDRLTPLVPPLPFLAAARISETTVMPTLTPVALPDASVPTPSVTPMPSPLSNQTQQPTVGTTSPSPKPIPTPTPATVVISLQNNSAVPRTLSSTIMQSIAPLWTFTRVYLFPSAVVFGVSLVAHQMFKRYKAEKTRLATEAAEQRQREAAERERLRIAAEAEAEAQRQREAEDAIPPPPPPAPVDGDEGDINARMEAARQREADEARAQRELRDAESPEEKALRIHNERAQEEAQRLLREEAQRLQVEAAQRRLAAETLERLQRQAEEARRHAVALAANRMVPAPNLLQAIQNGVQLRKPAGQRQVDLFLVTAQQNRQVLQGDESENDDDLDNEFRPDIGSSNLKQQPVNRTARQATVEPRIAADPERVKKVKATLTNRGLGSVGEQPLLGDELASRFEQRQAEEVAKPLPLSAEEEEALEAAEIAALAAAMKPNEDDWNADSENENEDDQRNVRAAFSSAFWDKRNEASKQAILKQQQQEQEEQRLREQAQKEREDKEAQEREAARQAHAPQYSWATLMVQGPVDGGQATLDALAAIENYQKSVTVPSTPAPRRDPQPLNPTLTGKFGSTIRRRSVGGDEKIG